MTLHRQEPLFVFISMPTQVNLRTSSVWLLLSSQSRQSLSVIPCYDDFRFAASIAYRACCNLEVEAITSAPHRLLCVAHMVRMARMVYEHTYLPHIHTRVQSRVYSNLHSRVYRRQDRQKQQSVCGRVVSSLCCALSIVDHLDHLHQFSI